MFAACLPIRIVVNLSSSSDNNAAPDLLHPCPECGRPVSLSSEVAGVDDGSVKLDRLAHALCGCYVLSMPAGGLTRLLFSVLDAGGDITQLGPE
jgi:hypothetical protein